MTESSRNCALSVTINMLAEQLVSLAELAEQLPQRRGGKPVNRSTVYRWTTIGIRGGIKLESVQIGGTRCTSMEAFARFCNRLGTLNDATTTVVSKTMDLPKRLTAVSRQLDNLGI